MKDMIPRTFQMTTTNKIPVDWIRDYLQHFMAAYVR